jgi:hypothetical protein
VFGRTGAVTALAADYSSFYVALAPPADQTITGAHFLNLGTVGGTDAATLAINGVGIRPTDVSAGNNTLLYLDAQPSNPWHTLFHNIGDPAANFTIFAQATAPNYGFTIQSFTATNSPNLTIDPINNQINFAAGSTSFIVNGSSANAGVGAITALSFGSDAALSRLGAASLALGTLTVGDFSGSLKLTTLNSVGSVSGKTYLTVTNCSSAASPAVCAAAAAGVVAVPTGTNPTLQVNTTAVTANSRIFLEIDESSTIAATTCNTTLSTLVQPVVTARSAGVSFTIQIGAILASNPACVSYFIVN